MSEELGYDPFSQDIDTGGADADSIHSGGGNFVSAEGKFHVTIESVEINDYDADKKSLPFVNCLFRVHAGEVESEAGKALNTRLYLASWANRETKDAPAPLAEAAGKGLLAFLHSFGVIGDDAFGSDSVKINRGMFERLENTQAIIKVTKGKDRSVIKDGEEKIYPGRYEMQWSNDCWPLNHEKVADVPKDMELAAATGVEVVGPAADDLDDI